MSKLNDAQALTIALENQHLMDRISVAKKNLQHCIDLCYENEYNHKVFDEADQKLRAANMAAVDEIEKLFGNKLTIAQKFVLFSMLTKNT
jgi:hypothetical protein